MTKMQHRACGILWCFKCVSTLMPVSHRAQASPQGNEMWHLDAVGGLNQTLAQERDLTLTIDLCLTLTMDHEPS